MILDRVARTREIEVARFHRRHDDRTARAAALTRAHPLGPAQHLEIVEHEDRRLVPAEILDRTRDLAFFDQERAVAREAGVENRALIDAADVPEARAENPA